MRRLIAVVLCLIFPVAAFGREDNGYKVIYDGGSLQTIKAGATRVWTKKLRSRKRRRRSLPMMPAGKKSRPEPGPRLPE